MMPTYRNGEVPYAVVSVVLATGTDANGYWEFRCTPAFAARWAQAKRNAERMFGRTIYIRTGWNIYRPLGVQADARKRACAAGNCNGASVAGYSSHGGNWGGRDCLAVDVDPNGLTWDQVDQAMEAAGFSARLITEAMSGIPGGERWHYIDFNAFGPIPAGLESEEFDMPLNAETDYKAFATMLQRALKFDVRPNGVGATYTLGPTVFELLRAADDSADVKAIKVEITAEDRAAIADLVVKGIKIPEGAATPEQIAAAVKAGLDGLTLTASAT